MPKLPSINLAARIRGALNRIWKRDSLRVTTQPIRSGNPNRYMEPKALMRFGLSPLVARRIVEGFISGLHHSPFHGFSVEFADHREYVPGDDLKFLDWMLYARTDHYYIKRSEDETNVRCFVLLDRSASMAFGTTGMTKWDYACFLVTCLAYLMLKQQDAVGLALFGSTPGVMVPPRCRNTHLHRIMRVMVQNPPSGATAISSSLQAMLRRIKRRSLVVLVSDLLDDPEETIKTIRLFAGHRHEVLVFHIQDPVEIDFNFEGAALFKDLETGEELEVDPLALRDTYRQRAAEAQEFFRKGLSEMKIDYQPLDTSRPYDLALYSYLRRRAGLRA